MLKIGTKSITLTITSIVCINHYQISLKRVIAIANYGIQVELTRNPLLASYVISLKSHDNITPKKNKNHACISICSSTLDLC